MELKRKIYARLLEWKAQNGRTAMFIDGARRVGKSYIAELFAKQEYKSYILIDFANVANDITDLIENESYDLDLFFVKLSAFFNKVLYRRESLIIFDEVQQFPRARQLIKYLVADGRYNSSPLIYGDVLITAFALPLRLYNITAGIFIYNCDFNNRGYTSFTYRLYRNC